MRPYINEPEPIDSIHTSAKAPELPTNHDCKESIPTAEPRAARSGAKLIQGSTDTKNLF